MLGGVHGEPRVYRVSRIEDAEMTDETFERPAGFDLRSAWAAQVGRFKGSGPERVSVKVRVDPDVSGRFTRLIGDQIVERRSDGVVVLDFPACEAAVSLLAAFGRTVEVLEPPDLRQRLAEIGRQLSSLYAG
jgi:predicted DNA-binding transcriptional regulator YafY